MYFFDLDALREEKKPLNTNKANRLMDKKSSREELGSKSIFYDPEWNPKGLAPPGFRNISYNPITFTRKQNSFQKNTLGLQGINLPKEDEK